MELLFQNYHVIACIGSEGMQENLSFAKLNHDFGDGYNASELIGSSAGLRTFSIPFNALTAFDLNTDTNRYWFRGRKYNRAEYIQNLFAYQMRTGTPYAARSPLTGQIYLVRFAESETSLTKKLNAVYDTQIRLVQVRLQTDAIYDIGALSGVYGYYDANYFRDFDDGDNITNPIWLDYSGNGNHLGTVNGGNTYHPDEYKGLPAICFHGNTGGSYFQRNENVTLYEAYFLMKFAGDNFDYNQGILSGATGGEVMLVSNSSGTNFYDLDGEYETYESEINGIGYSNSAVPAPFGEYKVVHVRYQNGIPLSKIQLGKDRGYTDRYGDFYLQAFVPCDGLLTEIESRELTEYLLSDRQIFIPADEETPSVPEMTEPSDITSASIQWNWNAATDNVAVTHYDLQVATNAGFTTGLRTINLANVLLYNDTGLTLGTTYYARVRAKDAAGNVSEYSTSVNAEPEFVPFAKRINAGSSSAVGLWLADTGYGSSGTPYDAGSASRENLEKQRPGRVKSADTSVYGTLLTGGSTRTITGLTPSAPCQIRLHSFDGGFGWTGQKIRVNGVDVIASYAPATDGGGTNHVDVKSFTADANSSGEVVIELIITGGGGGYCALEVHQPAFQWKKLDIGGDSLTEGGGIITYTNRWVGLLGADKNGSVPDTNYGIYNPAYDETKPFNFHVLAQSGNRIEQQTAYVPDYVNAYVDPLYTTQGIFLMCGINNLINTSENAAGLFSKIQDFYNAVSSDITWRGISTILPSTSAGGSKNDTRIALNNLILENTLGLDFVLDAAADSRLSNPSNETYYQPDALHLNPTGQAVYREIFEPAFEDFNS